MKVKMERSMLVRQVNSSATHKHAAESDSGVKPFQCGDRLYSSESDVYKRQILTSKVDPRSESINKIIFRMTVVP